MRGCGDDHGPARRMGQSRQTGRNIIKNSEYIGTQPRRAFAGQKRTRARSRSGVAW